MAQVILQDDVAAEVKAALLKHGQDLMREMSMMVGACKVREAKALHVRIKGLRDVAKQLG